RPPLTAGALHLISILSVGRAAAARKRRGKSGLHGDTVPDNVRRGFSPRKQGAVSGKVPQKTYRSPDLRERPVRVKRCGKSAPRFRRRKRQGKPHREQSRIGTTRTGAILSRPVFGPVVRVGCLRRRANGVPEEWLPRGRNSAIQNPAYRPADA